MPIPVPRVRRGAPVGALVGLLVVAALAGAAGCGGGPANPYPGATNPPNTGATCDDNTGDLSRVAGERGGVLREPAGIDLTRAEARVTETAVRVSFGTAGRIAGTPNPEFRLGQGPAGQVESFELVASPGDGGVWVLRLVTFRPDNRGGVQEAPRSVLAAPVTVEGTTLSYEVPLHDLPKIATYVWLFGSSSTSAPDADDTVIDDCDHYGGAAGSTTAPPTTAAPTAGTVGDTLTYAGSPVTVLAVEPVAGDPGTGNVAIDVRVCAPPTTAAEVRADHLSVSAADDRSYGAGDVAAARQPSFPPVVVLEAGACRRAWVTVAVPDAAPVVAVVYSPDPTGAGALRWRVP